MSYLSDQLGEAYKEGMTEDEISAALEAKYQSRDAEMNRLKNALTKANSEAAEYKKKNAGKTVRNFSDYGEFTLYADI